MWKLMAMTALAAGLFGQVVEEFAPPKAGCCLAGAAQSLADQLQDWNQLGRYAADNPKVAPGGVVFLGDSITDAWKLGEYFPGKPYVNRGISGQTTAQMLVRMMPDVIRLRPAAMILLAGTNDVARNTGPVTMRMITDNIEAMVELAKGRGIQVVLCSVLPVSDYTARPKTGQRPPAQIVALNAWLKSYAAKVGAGYVDYYSALVDEKGMLRAEVSGDGLHPNAAGYAVMAPLAEAGIRGVLGR